MKAFAEWFGAAVGVFAVLYAVAALVTMFRLWREGRAWLAACRLKPGQRRFLYTHPDGTQEWLVSSPREEP